MKSVAFVPIKLNNERLPGKNLMPFKNGKPLLNYIFNAAKESEVFDEIYCFCSNDEIKQYLPDFVTFQKRSTELDTSTTTASELVFSFSNTISSDVYSHLHATTPFISPLTIKKAVKSVISQEYDSSFTVSKHYDFMWINNKPNYDLDNVPRTQDLQPTYFETSGIYTFISSLAKRKRRIGDNPYIIELTQIEAVDIDTKEDFEIAEAIYNWLII